LLPLGLSKQSVLLLTVLALHNWLPMIRLALPGLLMVEAECLAFEILTLAASYFGTSHLAAQVRIAESFVPRACSGLELQDISRGGQLLFLPLKFLHWDMDR